MSYKIEVRVDDIEYDPDKCEPYAIMRLRLITPDGHFLDNFRALSAKDETWVELGLEAEAEAVERGEIKGMLRAGFRED